MYFKMIFFNLFLTQPQTTVSGKTAAILAQEASQVYFKSNGKRKLKKKDKSGQLW